MTDLLDFETTEASPIGQPSPLLQAGVKAPLPLIIDSTMMVGFRACKAQFHRAHVLKRSLSGSSIHLRAGGAFASGIEAYRRAYYADGYSPSACLEAAYLSAMLEWGPYELFPEGYAESKSIDRVMIAIKEYFERWPCATDLFQPEIREDSGQPTIEFSAAIPLDPEKGFPLHPSGEPFIWHLRSDGLGNYKNLSVFSDEKTTTSIGASWASKWLMRNQFLSYAWCYREMGMPHQNVLVRGVGLLKTKISLAEALVQYPPHMLDMWEKVAKYDLHQMVQHWELDFWPETIGDACTSWGNCQFTDICTAPPKMKLGYLANGYMHSDWDPASTHNRRNILEQKLLAQDTP